MATTVHGVSAQGVASSARTFGIGASGRLGRQARVHGVGASGVLGSSDGRTVHGISSSATLSSTADRVQATLRDRNPLPQARLVESKPRPVFHQWMEDEHGHFVLVTMQDNTGNQMGWDGDNTGVVEAVDSCARKLFAVTRNASDAEDRSRAKNAETLNFIEDTDGSSAIEADLSRKVSRSTLGKLGCGMYDMTFGLRYGPTRVGLDFGGTVRCSSAAAGEVATPFADLKRQLASAKTFCSEASFEPRRNLDALLRRHRTELHGSAPVLTKTKIETISASLKHHKLDDDVVMHEAVTVENGEAYTTKNGLKVPLDPDFFENGKDVIVPITLVRSNGRKHGVSLYYQAAGMGARPQLYYYDSVGKKAAEGGAGPVIEAITGNRPISGISYIARGLYPSVEVHEAECSDHQQATQEDCARYSILFFEKMLDARKEGVEKLRETFDSFTQHAYGREEIERDMSHVTERIESHARQKRWHPDDVQTAPPTESHGSPIDEEDE